MIVVVGAGIVGLLCAFEIEALELGVRILVMDAGADPRTCQNFQTPAGATWSGLDARHVSITESGPWTSSGREILIDQPARRGGWNGLDGAGVDVLEDRWASDFCKIVGLPELHQSNSARVYALNRAGLFEWCTLSARYPELFAPLDDSGSLSIVCQDTTMLHSEFHLESSLDPGGVTDPVESIPAGLAPLRELIDRGVVAGSFDVRGTAYRIQSLCVKVLDYLESRGVEFVWNEVVSLSSVEAMGSRDDHVLWTAGVSLGSSDLLEDLEFNLQGVVGCWVSVPNPGFERPFKVLADEPVNFMNCTPVGDELLVSGGYGWMGRRSYGEASERASGFARLLAKSVDTLVTPGAEIVDTAACLRPSLPTGVPMIGRVSTTGDMRVSLSIGHAAGGFTQAPVSAKLLAGLAKAELVPDG